MTPVTEIPPEIILAIAERLPRNEILALRRVCILFAETLASECYHRIVIDVSSTEAQSGLDALRTLALETEDHLIRDLARILVIKRFHRDLLLEGSEALNWVHMISSQFTHIRTLEWSQEVEFIPYGEESPDARSALLVRALQSLLPSLKEVKISQGLRELHLPILDGLSQLSLLYLHSTQYVPTGVLDGKVLTSVYAAISRSSDTLEHLILALPPAKGSCSTIIELMQATNLCPFPRLTTLSLEIQMDLETTCPTWSLAPQFSSLQALHFRGRQPYNADWPSHQDDIFTVLANSKIYLREVSSCVSAPLLQYLASYEDMLEKLAISDGYWGKSNKALSVNFNSTLSKHKWSLRELRLYAPLDDGWAFGENNNDLLLGPLPALETIKIPLYMEDHLLKSCLDRALDHANFPRLHHISLNLLVDTPGMRGVGTCGRYFPARYKSCHTRAVKVLYSYRFAGTQKDTNTRNRLPILNTGTQDFHPSFDEDSQSWRYVPRVWMMTSVKSQWESCPQD